MCVFSPEDLPVKKSRIFSLRISREEFVRISPVWYSHGKYVYLSSTDHPGGKKMIFSWETRVSFPWVSSLGKWSIFSLFIFQLPFSRRKFVSLSPEELNVEISYIFPRGSSHSKFMSLSHRGSSQGEIYESFPPRVLPRWNSWVFPTEDLPKVKFMSLSHRGSFQGEIHESFPPRIFPR